MLDYANVPTYLPNFVLIDDPAIGGLGGIYEVTDAVEGDVLEFQPGDLVTLKSGGPDMCVTGVCGDCGDVFVSWFNYSDDFGWEYETESFPDEALLYVEEGD